MSCCLSSSRLKYHQPLGMIFPQHDFDEFPSERARPARHQNDLFRPIHQACLMPVMIISCLDQETKNTRGSTPGWD